MLYHSTRNADLTAPSTHAVLEGIAPDGGDRKSTRLNSSHSSQSRMPSSA